MSGTFVRMAASMAGACLGLWGRGVGQVYDIYTPRSYLPLCPGYASMIPFSASSKGYLRADALPQAEPPRCVQRHWCSLP